VFLEKSIFISWIFTVIIAIIIFYFSSLSLKGTGGTGYLSYVYHFFVFFWLAFFLGIAITRGKNINLILPSVFLATIYAVFDEIHQLFVPFRACSFSDFLIDLAGILTASLLYLATIRIRNSTSSESF